MNRLRMGMVLTIVGLLAAPVTVDAAGKVRERSTQISHAFVNNTGVTVHGLVVKLSHPAVAVRDDDHKVGDFRNYNGNDTTKIYLSNATRSIDAGGVVELAFRSYDDGARITKFWWTDASGKRIGVKKKT